jgi:SAM-dependent methyltransferase
MRKVRLLKSWAQESGLLEKHIKQKATDGVPLHILEAGCGQNWPLELEDIQFTLTGNDIDRDMLLLRKAKHNDLDEMIVGDLRFLDLQEHRYDVIFNSYVLEHIDGAEGVLENFSNWLKPGGILILRIPDRNSVRGFVARNTPFWFHMFYVKYILGLRDAGTTGEGPFRAFYDPIVSRAGIHEFCRKNRFIIKEEFGHGSHLESKGIRGILIYLFVRAVSLLSLGKLASDHTDITYILEKELETVSIGAELGGTRRDCLDRAHQEESGCSP